MVIVRMVPGQRTKAGNRVCVIAYVTFQLERDQISDVMNCSEDWSNFTSL